MVRVPVLFCHTGQVARSILLAESYGYFLDSAPSHNPQRDLLSRRVLSRHFDLDGRPDELPPDVVFRFPDLGRSPTSGLAGFDGVGSYARQDLAVLVPKRHSVRKKRFEVVFAGRKCFRPDAEVERDLHLENIAANLATRHADRQHDEYAQDHLAQNVALSFDTSSPISPPTDVREFERKAHTTTYFRALTENSLACMDPACSGVKSNVPMLMLRNSRPCQPRRIIPVGE